MLHAKKGFTLIELMIVVVIVAVLSAIAYPSYMQYRIRENRTEVKAAMTQIGQKLSAYKLANNNYSTTLSNTAIYGSAVYPQSGSKTYDLALTVSATAWSLQATPAGRQVGNGILVLNDQGWMCWVQTSDTIPCVPIATSTWDGN